MTDINVSEGELVWYNERKGYGFIRIRDTEVFLHRSTLDRPVKRRSVQKYLCVTNSDKPVSFALIIPNKFALAYIDICHR